MRKLININILDIRNDQLYMAGTIYNYDENVERFYILDEERNALLISPCRASALDREQTEEKKERKGYYYEILLPLLKGAHYSFYCEDLSGNEGTRRQLSPRYRRFSRLTNLEHSFFAYKDLLICSEDDSICVHRNLPHTRFAVNRRFNKTLGSAPAKAVEIRKKAIDLRAKSKPIWLISDRTDSAGDNGEALFEYLIRTGATDDYDIYFLIDPSSADYERMQKVGPVIPLGSEAHKVAFLASSMIISSAADGWVMNPFGADLMWYQDLIDHPFVFLQHGIIKDDLSKWLFLLNKNIRMFVTSSKPEYDSVCKGNYGYDESIVKLTGLARYDKLKNEPQKKIAIIPTWRKSAAPDCLSGASERPYSEQFKYSEYFLFYNRLINDPRLLQAMNEAGYTGTFYLHPSHANQAVDFSENEIFTVWKGIVPFSRVFCESSLLITDYSSVAFDFAYLDKPVVYAQFDREEFFSSHTYDKGYFDYRTDGFGPVCDTYEETLSVIIDIIKNDCRQNEIYRQRLESFYTFRDGNNCKRIFDEIRKLENTI